MSVRTVFCKKLGKEAPGLQFAPFAGELGEEVYNNTSAEAWAMWQELQIKIINEYRLNLAEAEHFNVLLEQMKAFLNLDQVAGSNVLAVENAERGKTAG